MSTRRRSTPSLGNGLRQSASRVCFRSRIPQHDRHRASCMNPRAEANNVLPAGFHTAEIHPALHPARQSPPSTVPHHPFNFTTLAVFTRRIIPVLADPHNESCKLPQQHVHLSVVLPTYATNSVPVNGSHVVGPVGFGYTRR